MSGREIAEEERFSCPSFSSYAANALAEIAEEVASESTPKKIEAVRSVGDEGYGNGDDDFEFALQLPEEIAWASSDGRIFPVFNRDLLPVADGDERRIAVPLSVLLKKEKSLRRSNADDDSYSSSSEADELENVPSSTYCVWRPPNKCKKSPSAGSASSRWAALRGLMKRSNSEGMKDKLVFLAAKKKKSKEDGKARESNNTTAKATKGPLISSSSSAHEDFYVRNRAVKEGDRKKSYLPYRKELVGFFLNGNGFLPHL